MSALVILTVCAGYACLAIRWPERARLTERDVAEPSSPNGQHVATGDSRRDTAGRRAGLGLRSLHVSRSVSFARVGRDGVPQADPPAPSPLPVAVSPNAEETA